MPSLLSRLLTPDAHDHAEADASPAPRRAARRRRCVCDEHALHASLRELKLASQGQSISQAAEEALAEALACNSTITKLTLDTRSTRARDLIAKGLLANQERLRRERSSSAYTYVAVADSPLGRRG